MPHSTDAFWRAANYLSVGQIYLRDNALLREPLRPEHVKPRLLGHWGTSPGLNLVVAHVNQAISSRSLQALLITGPGHGGPAIVASSWLDGSWTEAYPSVGRDADGMLELFRRFSTPYGIPSHVAPDVPGSIHEGGELGYSLAHAFGAAFDNRDLTVFCVVGDGEAETGALATSWQSPAFANLARDGAVVPVLHLNGYKIANPTVLARRDDATLASMFRGFGWEPVFVEGSDGETLHGAMADAMQRVLDDVEALRSQHEDGRFDGRWPMIVLRSPKGMTGPTEVDELPVEGTWRSHQVPLSDVRDDPDRLALLERWLRSYRPEELFDEAGRPTEAVLAGVPPAELRLGSSPHANGGRLTRELSRPRVEEHAVHVTAPGRVSASPAEAAGDYLRDVVAADDEHVFRLFGPDEVGSNKLSAVLDVTDRAWTLPRLATDENLGPDGRVMEVLSEHLCQGWLEGYLLSGRHGVFSCYEAFVHIVDSMVNQHAKWLGSAAEIDWRRPVPSLNYLLTSHVWRQDHNGFSHQDPGFVDHVVNKRASVVRVYLPPDANTLLWTLDHCLASRDRINVMIAGKHEAPAWLDVEEAGLHCARGLGAWDWASSDEDVQPDVVLACAGDVPTLEVLAAAQLLREHLPEVAVRVVNVVDLMRLQSPEQHPHGLPGDEFDSLFTPDRPVVFAYHGYPWLIHRLTYRRTNHDNVHVRGYVEQGSTTTPFDMVVRNDIDRYHLVMDVIDRVPGLGRRAADVRQDMADRRTRHVAHVREYGEDMPEIREWQWSS
jgi:xylulose-5-phosphate/fructose-6-phosphate phosphoketolase